MPAKKCPGATWLLQFTMLGDMVRKCEKCGAVYTVSANLAEIRCAKLDSLSARKGSK